MATSPQKAVSEMPPRLPCRKERLYSKTFVLLLYVRIIPPWIEAVPLFSGGRIIRQG